MYCQALRPIFDFNNGEGCFPKLWLEEHKDLFRALGREVAEEVGGVKTGPLPLLLNEEAYAQWCNGVPFSEIRDSGETMSNLEWVEFWYENDYDKRKCIVTTFEEC